MAFESFAHDDSVALPRARRLALSTTSAVLLLGAIVAAAAVAGGKRATAPKDDVVDVVLAKLPEPAPKPVAVSAPPALAPTTVKIAHHAPAPTPVAPPTAQTREKLREADPKDDKGAAGVSTSGDPAGAQGGTGSTVATPATTAAPPPSPPAPPPAPQQRTVAIDENTEPPVAISQPHPAVPDELRKEGVDSISVVVRFVVTETGDVSGATIVRGHPLLDAAVLAAVLRWKFRPATSQGRPVPFPKTVKIPFKLRT